MWLYDFTILVLLLSIFPASTSPARVDHALPLVKVGAFEAGIAENAEEFETGIAVLERAMRRRNTGSLPGTQHQAAQEAQILAHIGAILLRQGTTTAAAATNTNSDKDGGATTTRRSGEAARGRRKRRKRTARAARATRAAETMERAAFALEQALDRDPGDAAVLAKLGEARAARQTCLEDRGVGVGGGKRDAALLSVRLHERTLESARKDYAALHHWFTTQSRPPVGGPSGAARADVDIVWTAEGGGRIFAARDFAPGETIIHMTHDMLHIAGDGKDVNDALGLGESGRGGGRSTSDGEGAAAAGKERSRFLEFVKHLSPPEYPPHSLFFAGTVPYIIW